MKTKMQKKVCILTTHLDNKSVMCEPICWGLNGLIHT